MQADRMDRVPGVLARFISRAILATRERNPDDAVAMWHRRLRTTRAECSIDGDTVDCIMGNAGASRARTEPPQLDDFS